MLKVDINQEEVNVNVSGNLVDITTDITVLLAGIYKNLHGVAQKEFSRMLKEIVNDEIYTKTPEEVMQDTIKRANETFSDFLKSLRGD